MTKTVVSKSNNKYKKINYKQLFFYIALVTLPILQYFIFSIVVNFNTVILSLQKYTWNRATDQYEITWVGFSNFKKVFDQIFIEKKYDTMLKNSTIAYLSSLLITTPLALIFSYYISKKFRGSKMFRTILFMPTIISTVVLACVFRLIGETIIPNIIQKLFYPDIPFSEFRNDLVLASKYQLVGAAAPKTFGSLIFYHVFMGFGTNVLLYSGAMSAIDPSVVEAAKIDGCSDWKELIHIYIPGIFPTIISFIVVGIGAFFTQKLAIYDIFGSNANNNIQTVGYYLFNRSINAEKGLQKYELYPDLATLGVIFTLIVTPISFFVKHMLEKYGPNSR